MLRDLSNKSKFTGVVFLFLLMLIVTYNLNFKKTFSLVSQYKELKATMLSYTSDSQKIVHLRNRLDELNSMLGSSINHTDLHEKFLNLLLTQAGNNIKIWEFPKYTSFTNGDMIIYTNKLTLTGDFISIINQLYYLETKEKIGRIRSVNFESKKIRGTTNENLYVEIILQNIEFTQN